MNAVSRIDVKLDRRAFDIVLGTFSFMLDHLSDVIDSATLFISDQEIADFVTKLKTSDTGADEVTVTMNFNDWVVYSTLLSQTSSKIPQSDPKAYEVLEALWDEVGRLDDAGKTPRGPEVLATGRTWRPLSETEKILMAAQIDSQDPFNKYGANAGEICEVALSFYSTARLLRVTNRTPAVGNRYFIQCGDDLVPLHRLPEVQSFCDERFGVVQNSDTAADYFRFAHFFCDEGLRTSLVEAPQDLRIDASSSSPEAKQAIAFIKPPEIRSDKESLTVSVCTFDESQSRLYRDRYRLTPGQPLRLLSREDSGIHLGHPFHDRQLQIGRSVSSS
jgi:hypothetical protein